MHFTSLLTETAQADRSARDFLGDDHPLVRILRRRSAAIRHSCVVGAMLLVAAAARLEGLRGATAVALAAAVVEAALALQIASLRWLARERAQDLIIEGRADLPLDAVRRERRRLLGRAHCDDLAGWLDRTWTVTERALKSPHSPSPPYNVAVIAAARKDLADISARLREGAPGVRGVALVERLLSEGGSPLYGGSVSALRQELRRIRFMLNA